MQLVRSNSQLLIHAPDPNEALIPLSPTTIVSPKPLSSAAIVIHEPAIPNVPAPQPRQDTYAKTAAIAALSALVLTLTGLVGILIGRGTRTPIPKAIASPSPSPQIIVVPNNPPRGCQVFCFGGN
jgi:hypothetical protein